MDGKCPSPQLPAVKANVAAAGGAGRSRTGPPQPQPQPQPQQQQQRTLAQHAEGLRTAAQLTEALFPDFTRQAQQLGWNLGQVRAAGGLCCVRAAGACGRGALSFTDRVRAGGQRCVSVVV